MRFIAGVDEVGRGSLIGPVYAAAVILNKSIDKKLLKDSKSLNKSKREALSKYIKKNSIWAVGRASVIEIEKINIFKNLSHVSMDRKFELSSTTPNNLFILKLILLLISLENFLILNFPKCSNFN